LDEPSFYDRVLSQTDINTLYNWSAWFAYDSFN
jgi:hypothetical protein